MEKTRKPKRFFTPDQKFNISQTIEADVKKGLSQGQALEKHGIGSSLFQKWRKQLAVGVRSSLRNGKSPADKNLKQLERRIAKLESVILSQAQLIADLKKETNWD